MTRIPLFAMACLAAMSGCASSVSPKARIAPATQPVTSIDPQLATPAYWYDLPGTSWVRHSTYDALFKASQKVAVDFQFPIDRRDYRDGVVTTVPVVSAQFFEPWKRDVQTLRDLALSSTATHRRTIRFEIARLTDGSYEMTPKVLVERQTVAERRITSEMYFRYLSFATNTYGTRETDVGVILLPFYWYAVGRDHTLERSLAAAVWNKLHPSGLFNQ